MDDNRRYEAFVRNRITELREQKLFNHGRYEKNRCENCARRGFLAQLLHIMCYAF